MCIALEDLSLLFSGSTAVTNVDGAGSGPDAAGASCLPSLLFKFLTDRSVRAVENTSEISFPNSGEGRRLELNLARLNQGARQA